MFEELKKEYLQDREQRKEKDAFYIIHGFYESWSEEHKTESDNGLERYSTERRWEQYQNGEIDRETACAFAVNRMNKKIKKEIEKELAHLESVANAPEVDYITVNVEYKRSSIWGYNPAVKVITNSESGFFTGYASGCGYDKESAAVAEAFSKSLGIMKILYTLKEKALESGLSDESKDACTGHDNRNCIGYGAGYSVIPYFEGGVGVSCFWSILKKAGFDISCNYGKHKNYYTVSK